MFTSLDKAIVAFVMAIVYFFNNFLGTHLNIDPTMIQTLVVTLLPFLVYLVPNKKIA